MKQLPDNINECYFLVRIIVVSKPIGGIKEALMELLKRKYMPFVRIVFQNTFTTYFSHIQSSEWVMKSHTPLHNLNKLKLSRLQHVQWFA